MKTRSRTKRGTFEIYEQNLQYLEKSLQRSENAKDKIVGILDQFENSFSKLEYELVLLNRRIDVLKTSCDNIDKTIKHVEVVEAKYSGPAKAEKRMEQGVNSDIKSFLQALDQADDSLKFFSRNEHYKGAALLKEQLLFDRQTAIKQLQNEFFAQLVISLRRNVDPYAVGAKDSLVDKLISSEGLALLTKIARRLDSLNDVSYRKVLIDGRSRVIIRILSKIYPLPTLMEGDLFSDIFGDVFRTTKQMYDVTAATTKKVVDVTTHTTKQMYDVTAATTKKVYDVTSSTTKKVKDFTHFADVVGVGNIAKRMKTGLGVDHLQEKLHLKQMDNFVNSTVGAVVHDTGQVFKSSLGVLRINVGGDLKNFESDSGNKFMFFMSFYLQLLQAEKQIVQEIVEEPHALGVFESVVEPSWKLFVQSAEDIASQSQSNDKVFALLNVLEVFEGKLQVEFGKVLKGTNLAGQEIELDKTFTKDISQTIKEFKNEISFNNIPVSPDGTIHQATANAIGFIKRLFTYTSVQEVLQSIYKLPNGYTSGAEIFIDTLLKAVDTNIENKALNYSDKALRQIFVLNNYYYVWIKLQSQSQAEAKTDMTKTVKSFILKRLDTYAQKVTDTIKAVVTETWQGALKNLDVNEAKDYIKPDKKNQYSRSSRNDLKRRLTNFNKLYLEIYNTQRKYSLYNLELKERLRKQMIETVIPAYNSFEQAFCQIEFTRKRSKYVSYSAASMESMLLQLFDEEREERNEASSANDFE